MAQNVNIAKYRIKLNTFLFLRLPFLHAEMHLNIPTAQAHKIATHGIKIKALKMKISNAETQ